ncbi:hypothetical protein [Coprobacter tertius]|nr:hypothetical protein [Coprobacter tertius]
MLIFLFTGCYYYINGTTDWMIRNFDRYIEVITSIFDKSIQKDSKKTIEYDLIDTLHGQIINGSGFPRFRL